MTFDRIIEAISILREHGASGYINGADHDIIYWSSKPATGELDNDVIQRLDDLGVFWSDEYDCWVSYV